MDEKQIEQFRKDLAKNLPSALSVSRIKGRPLYYILQNRKPIPASMFDWAVSLENGPRHVALTRIGPFEVSTVFLGMDHAFLGGPPILFETMTFLSSAIRELPDYQPGDAAFDGNEMDGRVSTWEEAVAMHRNAVNWVMKHYCAPTEQPVEIEPPQGLL